MAFYKCPYTNNHKKIVEISQTKLHSIHSLSEDIIGISCVCVMKFSQPSVIKNVMAYDHGGKEMLKF